MEHSQIKLVLLPGMDGTGDLFADFVAALPCDLAAQVVGYPNDKFLSYSQLLELIDSRVPASPYVVVAESYSSTVAIQFAARRPPNLQGLVLSAGFATSPLRGWTRLLCRGLLPIMPWLPIPEIAAGLLFQRKAPILLQIRIRDAIRSAAPKVLRDRARAALTCNVLEDLRAITVPVLYLQARYDSIVNRACGEEIRSIRPDTRVVVLDGPHVLLQAMPRETARIVTDFVRRL